MANRTTPYPSGNNSGGGKYTGWYKDMVTPALKYYLGGTLVMTVQGNDLTLADKLTVTGTSALVGAPTIGAYVLPVADGTATYQLTASATSAVTWSAKS